MSRAALRVELEQLAPVAAPCLAYFYEMRNVLEVGEAVTRSALHRKESRGAHFRIDHPEKADERWRIATRVFRRGGPLQVDERDFGANAAIAACGKAKT